VSRSSIRFATAAACGFERIIEFGIGLLAKRLQDGQRFVAACRTLLPSCPQRHARKYMQGALVVGALRLVMQSTNTLRIFTRHDSRDQETPKLVRWQIPGCPKNGSSDFFQSHVAPCPILGVRRFPHSFAGARVAPAGLGTAVSAENSAAVSSVPTISTIVGSEEGGEAARS